MQETPQQYTQRILGYLEGKDLMEVLAATPRQISRIIKGVSRRKLAVRTIPDKWSVTEILAHLADSEMVYGYRIRIILEAENPPIQATNQDKWAAFSDYAAQDPFLALQSLTVDRQRLLSLLKQLPPASWELYGVHSERGNETVRRVAEMLAGHDLNHLAQIRERLPKK
ncbi:MAG TPA: DinB family protein [bacterium]|nr:DinB family protein [bacterium]